MDISREAIRKTIIYSDIFDYPLTFDQLYTFLIAKNRFSRDSILNKVETMNSISKKNGYYMLKGRENLAIKRKEKEYYNSIKLRKAKKIARLLSYIPSIFFIGISGGVALQNAEKDDDIDLFIITKKNTVWITRLLVISWLGTIGILRTRNSKNLSNKFCVNMFLDETALAFAKEKQDLYVAHEIVQLFPLIERNNVFHTFLKKNNWVFSFLPHWEINKYTVESASNIPFFHRGLERVISNSLLEKLAGVIQKKKMKQFITSEIITESILAFHPYDYRTKTLLHYNKRITNEKI